MIQVLAFMCLTGSAQCKPIALEVESCGGMNAVVAIIEWLDRNPAYEVARWTCGQTKDL